MGTINYGTSLYITMGVIDGLDEYEQITIYDDVKELINNYSFDYFQVEIETGYYNGFYLELDHFCNNYDFEWMAEKREALKELKTIKEFLIECYNAGMVVVYPGWCMGYDTNKKDVMKDINKALKLIKKDILSCSVEYKSSKQNELVSLIREHDGSYTASMYDRVNNYYHDYNFMYYTKKQIYYILRHDHDCVISREFN